MIMDFDTSWDVNKYKYHYELPHHWELKKGFIEFHKKSYPEDRLVCLAQIFCNIHYLGCRYSDDIMELIDDLTKGLTDHQRDAKFDKDCFSLASSAVEERVKSRLGQPSSSNVQTVRRTSEPIAFVKAAEPDKRPTGYPEGASFKRAGEAVNGGQSKAPKFFQNERPSFHQNQQSDNWNQLKNQRDRPSFNQNRGQNQWDRHNQGSWNSHSNQNQLQGIEAEPRGQREQPSSSGPGEQSNQSKRLFSFEARRAAAMVKDVVDSGPFGRVVVFKSSVHNDGIINIIERSASAAHMRTSYDFTQLDDKFSCKFCLDGIYVAHGEGKNQKAAKEAACQLAIERLQETSFTIEVKAPYIAGETIERDMSGNQPKAAIEIPLAESNIGSKMLKMMGWTGGGLGKDGEGIEEPIKPHDQSIKRGGLGITNFSDFRKKVTRIIEEFAHSSDKNDLVFSPDFTKDERKTIHDLVRKYNLKSRSYGKAEDIRHIVVFRKIQPLEIVEDLLACGGETQKYKLISPKPKAF